METFYKAEQQQTSILYALPGITPQKPTLKEHKCCISVHIICFQVNPIQLHHRRDETHFNDGYSLRSTSLSILTKAPVQTLHSLLFRGKRFRGFLIEL